MFSMLIKIRHLWLLTKKVRVKVLQKLLIGLAHRYRKAKIDCLSLFMCPLLAQLKIGFFSSFSAAAVYSTNETNKASLKQSIIFRCLWFGSMINGSFTLARFVCKNACDIVLPYCLPSLPWKLGSFPSLSRRPRWPRQVQWSLSRGNVISIIMGIALNFANVNTAKISSSLIKQFLYTFIILTTVLGTQIGHC
jgi:hypothetical protein